MARRKRHQSDNDVLLRRARRLVALARHETGASAPRISAQPGVSAAVRSLPPGRRRRIVGLIAELDLAIKAMRLHRDELGRKAGLVFRNRNVVSAYHRTSLLLRADKHTH